MIRLLLTLLALLTGLAAQASPGQARGLEGRNAEIGAVAATASLQHQPVPASLALVRAAPREVGASRDGTLPQYADAWLAVRVLPGIDRARE